MCVPGCGPMPKGCQWSLTNPSGTEECFSQCPLGPFPHHISLAVFLSVPEDLYPRVWFSFLGVLGSITESKDPRLLSPLAGPCSCGGGVPAPFCFGNRGAGIHHTGKAFPQACVLRFEPSHEPAWLSLGMGPHLFPENSAGGGE